MRVIQNIDQAEGQGIPLFSGFPVAAATLAAIHWILRPVFLGLPIGQLLAITAWLLYLLAISFAGNGVLGLQEGGWVATGPLEWLPGITRLDGYPAMDTLSAQLSLDKGAAS
jgi:high-affinity iron transporter